MSECAVVVGGVSSLCGGIEVSFGGGRIRREVGSEAKLSVKDAFLGIE
jgi:hypothetical protein